MPAFRPPGPVTHLLNAEFDLELRPRPAWRGRARIVRQVSELSVQAILGVDSGDHALVSHAIPGDFLAYLSECGITLPEIRLRGDLDPGTVLRPYGWTAEAATLNRSCHEPVEHPGLAVLRRVNGKSFSRELERRLTGTDLPGGPIRDPAQLESFLERSPADRTWVLKAEHGNSGLANRRLRGPRPSSHDLRFVERALREDDVVVIEPWLPRERDWSAVFDTPFDPESFRVHETINTRDGALVGALFEPGSTAPADVVDGLRHAASGIAGALESEGYRGPVCLDAFTWRDGDELRLRSLVDLNCRRSMSDAAYRLWRRLAPDRVLLYRFFTRRRLSLPPSFRQAVASLGEMGYDSRRREGILLLSPWRHAGQASNRLALAFVAGDRAGALRLESRFRDTFGKPA